MELVPYSYGNVDAKTQKDILDSMTPAVRKAAENIRELLAKSTASMLRTAWEIGRELDKAEKSRDKGFEPTAKIELALGIEPGRLRLCWQFYTDFSEKDLQWLLNARTSSGRSISWSHIVEVMLIPDRSKRMACLEEVIAQDLPVRDTLNLIRYKYLPIQTTVVANKEIVQTNPRSAGRPPKKAETLFAMLQDILNGLRGLSKRCQTCWNDQKSGLPSMVDEAVEYAADSHDIISKQLNEIEIHLTNLQTIDLEVLASHIRLIRSAIDSRISEFDAEDDAQTNKADSKKQASGGFYQFRKTR